MSSRESGPKEKQDSSKKYLAQQIGGRLNNAHATQKGLDVSTKV